MRAPRPLQLVHGQREALVDALRVPVPLVGVDLRTEAPCVPWAVLFGRDPGSGGLGARVDYVTTTRRLSADESVVLTTPADGACLFTVDVDNMIADVHAVALALAGASCAVACRVSNGVTGEPLFEYDVHHPHGARPPWTHALLLIYRRPPPGPSEWRVRALDIPLHSTVWPSLGSELGALL